MNLLLIGECRHTTKLAENQLDEWRRLWTRDPIGAPLTAPFAPAGTRVRAVLDRWLNNTEEYLPCQHANLLPPSPIIGEWNMTMARITARWLYQHARRRGLRLVLLGRRVAAAFGAEPGRFGDVVSVHMYGSRVPALLAPNPSGRNRWLNSAENRAYIEQRVREFTDPERIV